MKKSKPRRAPLRDDADSYAIGVEVLATEWLAILQLNKKMPNSLVARKMRLTKKHVEDILGGTPTLFDIVKMFHALGYKMHICAEDIKTGERVTQPPPLLPHARKHPHIRGQLAQIDDSTMKSRR
jgi:hypothetical protein